MVWRCGIIYSIRSQWPSLAHSFLCATKNMIYILEKRCQRTWQLFFFTTGWSTKETTFYLRIIPRCFSKLRFSFLAWASRCIVANCYQTNFTSAKEVATTTCILHFIHNQKKRRKIRDSEMGHSSSHHFFSHAKPKKNLKKHAMIENPHQEF